MRALRIFKLYLNNLFKNPFLNEENKAVLGVIDDVLNTAKIDIDLSKLELVINSSTGVWLDEWGSWFGVSRLEGESDSSYRSRIIAVIGSAKNTIPALIATVRSYINDPNSKIIIYEPYHDIKRFNISEFSGKDKFQSDDYYRSGIIDIRVPNYSIDESLRKAISQVRSAGIKVYYTNLIELSNDIGEPVVMKGLQEPYFQRITKTELKVNNGEILIRSGFYKPGMGIRSGKREVFNQVIQVINLPKVKDEIQLSPVQNYNISLLYAGRSTTAFRSGLKLGDKEYRGGFSGYPLSDFDLLNPLPWGDKDIFVKPKIVVSEAPPKIYRNTIRITGLEKVDARGTETQRGSFSTKVTQLKATLGRILDASSTLKIEEVGHLTIEETTQTLFMQPDVVSRSEPVV